MALLNRKSLSLDEQIGALRADLDAAIDARVAEIRKTCPGVPAGVIRNSIDPRPRLPVRGLS